ncbi:hypothetical protein [Anaeromassilibacillus senegalensis]|nr:hypothetical protein [Anaeromassilibacillus senegalensis]
MESYRDLEKILFQQIELLKKRSVKAKPKELVMISIAMVQLAQAIASMP